MAPVFLSTDNPRAASRPPGRPWPQLPLRNNRYRPPTVHGASTSGAPREGWDDDVRPTTALRRAVPVQYGVTFPRLRRPE